MHAVKKTSIFLLLICAGLFSSLAGGERAISADEKKVVVTVWTYHEDIRQLTQRFMDQSKSNITIDVIVIPYEAYLIKLKTVLRYGQDVPDIFLGDAAFVKELVESGYWEDLSAKPFNVDTKDMVPYVTQLGTDSRGRLRALSWHACVGGFYYRRSLAKEYLGTDDPQDVGEMLCTPEKFLQTARILKQKSGGKVKIIAGFDDYKQYLLAMRTKPFINKVKRFELGKPILDFFDTAKIMKDEKLILNEPLWSSAWFSNMNDPEPEIFGYALPTWGGQYLIKQYAGDTAGDWGLCRGPASYFWGGNWLGIYSGSLNKKAAWEFLKFATLNRDTLEWLARQTGDFVNSKTVIDKIKNEFASDLLSGQNYYEFFAQEAFKINGAIIGKYDNEISYFLMQAVNTFADGNSSKKQVLTDLRNNAEGYVNTYTELRKSADSTRDGALGDDLDEQAVLSVWSYNDEIKKLADRFQELNPDVKIKIIIIPYEEYLGKIIPQLESGKNAPDLFMGEAIHAKQFIDRGFWEDLSRPPYVADVSDMFPFTVQAAKDYRGGLRALCWQVWIGGYFYRRSLAKEYLGTDDPEKLGEMLAGEEKFLATGRKLRDQSGGKVKLLPGFRDYLRYALAFRKKPFVTGDKHLVFDEAVEKLFALARVFLKEALTANHTMWSSEWFEDLRKDAKDAESLGYSLPQWGVLYILKNEAAGTSGDWGVCKGPSSYFWGGSWIGIYKNSKNKELAWKFLQFIALNRETLEWWARDTGQFVNSKTVMNKLKMEISEEFLGGQKYFAFLAEEALKINGSLLTEYDETIQDILCNAIVDYLDKGISYKQAIEKVKLDVKNAYPELIVE